VDLVSQKLRRWTVALFIVSAFAALYVAQRSIAVSDTAAKSQPTRAAR
jgi:hypothetical protein